MDLKSSDDDTVERDYTEQETAKLREIFLDFGLILLGRKRAEISPTPDASASEGKEEEEEEKGEEEKEEEEEGKEEEEEGDKNSCESDQEWDVDSFEGVEFNSEDRRCRYLRQCYKSEGFDVEVDDLPTNRDRIYCGFNPLKLDAYFSPPNITGRDYMENMAKVVIDKYNESKKKNLVMDHIVKTVVILGDGVKAYITFMAPEGDPVEYQGKAEWKVWQRNTHPLLCRPASQQRKTG